MNPYLAEALLKFAISEAPRDAKVAGSRIRSMTRLEPLKEMGMNGFSMHVGNRQVGRILLRPSQGETNMMEVGRADVDPAYRHMGLGRKMYGETMRRLPGGTLQSGASVSPDAVGVWEKLRNTPGYQITPNPDSILQGQAGKYERQLDRKIVNEETGKRFAGEPYRKISPNLYTGSLSPKALIKTTNNSNLGKTAAEYALKTANDPVKKKIDVKGVPVWIEWEKGETRRYKNKGVVKYERLMEADYGYIPGTLDSDGEELDVYVGPDRTSSTAYVVKQMKKDGTFDEHKVMLGYASAAAARASYDHHMSNTPEKFGGMREIPVSALVALFGENKEASFGEFAAKAAPYVLGIGVPLATAGGILASKPGIRANVKNLIESKGTVQEKDMAHELPQEVVDTATRAHQALTERGIDPSALRIAVDAPPGSGKTTLSRALANELGVKHYGLDWMPHNKFHSMMGGGHIEEMPRAPKAGEILEHYNLLRSYDPEMFDVALHIQKDPEVIKQQILNRGRSAGMHTIMDYDKSLAVGRMAYDTLAGDSIDLGNGVMMKIRPKEGWGENQLDQQLQAKGIDPTKLTRHQKLLSLHEGKAVGGAGWTPYFKSPFTGGETAALAASVPVGIGAAMAARRFLG